MTIPAQINNVSINALQFYICIYKTIYIKRYINLECSNLGFAQLNSNLSKKKIEFTFADGVTHQAGDSYVIGKVAYISECINIAKDIPMGTKIITSLKIAGQAINCCFTYGNIIQSFNYIGCRCIVVESSITTESVIEIENGNYPSIIATCVLNV